VAGSVFHDAVRLVVVQVVGSLAVSVAKSLSVQKVGVGRKGGCEETGQQGSTDQSSGRTAQRNGGRGANKGAGVVGVEAPKTKGNLRLEFAASEGGPTQDRSLSRWNISYKSSFSFPRSPRAPQMMGISSCFVLVDAFYTGNNKWRRAGSDETPNGSSC